MVTIAYPPGRWDSEESQRVCSVKTAAGKTAQVHNRVLIWLKKKQKGNKDDLWVRVRRIFPLALF